LTAANFAAVKGHVHLVDALRESKRRQVAVELDLAGDGPLEHEMARRVRELGLEDVVRFLGRVPHEKLLADMASGRWHVAVLPSINTSSGEHEGTPVFLIEALACGMAVIATDTGGIAELLGDGAGLLVPPASPTALVDALESLSKDPGRRREIGARGRRRVEEAFAVEPIACALRARFAGSLAAATPMLKGEDPSPSGR